MAITRSTASRVRTGRIGSVTYYSSQGREISRAALNSSNFGASAKRTTAQQTRRVRWANLVNFYKNSRGWLFYAFENKRAGVSDYNKIMQLNVDNSTVALTRNQAASGACVVEPYQISEGSLMPIETHLEGAVYATNIAIGLTAITEQTTVADFSNSIVSANSWIRYNMQLSFVSYQQTTDSAGIPRVVCTPYEVTLSSSDTTPLRSYLPDFASNVVGGFLGTSANISPGCFAYVLSETINGKTYVSSQRLVNNNAAMISLFSSPQQYNEAIASYGVDATRFLESGSMEQQPTEQPFGINMVTFNNVVLRNGPTPYTLSSFIGQSLVVRASMAITSIDSLTAIVSDGKDSAEVPITFTEPATISGNVATLAATATTADSEVQSVPVVSLNMVINGKRVTWFVQSSASGGGGGADGE